MHGRYDTPLQPTVRMRVLGTTLLILALPVAPLAGQSPERPPARFQAASAPAPTPPAAAPAPRQLAADMAPRSQGMGERVLRIVGGAAVGAWVGYMASQVAEGDWEDQPALDRAQWAVGGAAVGLAVGLAIPVGRAGAADGSGETAEQPERNVLATADLRAAKASTMYQLIRSERPEWLRTRGTGSFRETARGSASGEGFDNLTVQKGIPTIRVYLDDSLLGGVEALRLVDPASLGEARFLEPAPATHRFGAGHVHGAILLITAPSG